MKKKSFFSGVNAKLALATVALTSVMFTSCEKEEFNVAPVELDPASATIAITVYDLGDRSIITEGLNITGDTEVKAGADGKIAPEVGYLSIVAEEDFPPLVFGENSCADAAFAAAEHNHRLLLFLIHCH